MGWVAELNALQGCRVRGDDLGLTAEWWTGITARGSARRLLIGITFMQVFICDAGINIDAVIT